MGSVHGSGSLDVDRRQRDGLLSGIDGSTFDVAVIGGGIKGACTYAYLRQSGYRVALLEAGDFAGGSSQASAMLIWGGLLYLRNLDLPVVWNLSAERDRLVRALPRNIRPVPLRYVVAPGGRPKAIIWGGLHAAWAMGCGRRKLPRDERRFSEQALLRSGYRSALSFEEAGVSPSDSRYVLGWLGSPSDDCPALSYCRMVEGHYDAADRTFRLEGLDALNSRPVTVRARWVVNAAGVWAEQVDRALGIGSPYVHILSKGVFFCVRRLPGHELALILETRNDGDCMSLLPWGPVSLWGPTETIAPDHAAAERIEPADVSLLLDELNRHIRRPVEPSDIVSLRCGIRPLAIGRGVRIPKNTLGLSRHCTLVVNRALPWITLYGGKLTDGPWIGQRVAEALRRRLAPTHTAPRLADAEPIADGRLYFPGLDEPLPDPTWCAARESCCRLEDYLRRRTNAAQWVARGGLGERGENLPLLTRIATALAGGDERAARQDVAAYRRRIDDQFDSVLSALR